MGYDLYITRRRHWSDTGSDITEAEWLAIIDRDSELQPAPEDEIGPSAAWWLPGSDDQLWLAWTKGIIQTKNPPPALVDKMVALARDLDATVQGEEGERYASGRRPPTPYRPSLAERIRAFVRRIRRPPVVTPAPLPPFAVGDNVRDIFGRVGTVVALDPVAKHGLGTISVRYEDGREVKQAMLAHGFSPIPKT